MRILNLGAASSFSAVPGYNVFTAGHPVTTADLAFSTGALIIALVRLAGLGQRQARPLDRWMNIATHETSP